jgi:hypothetical protein
MYIYQSRGKIARGKKAGSGNLEIKQYQFQQVAKRVNPSLLTVTL